MRRRSKNAIARMRPVRSPDRSRINTRHANAKRRYVRIAFVAHNICGMPNDGLGIARRKSGDSTMQLARAGSTASVVAAAIRERIAAGTYDDIIPSEQELMVEFQVSRYSMRAALQMLVDEGMIERHSGRGTFVTGREPSDGRWSARSIEDLIGEHLKRHPEVLSIGVISAGDYPSAMEACDAAPGTPLLMTERLYRLDHKPQVYMRGFMAASLAHHIVVADIGSGSLVRAVERASGRQVVKLRQFMGATIGEGRVKDLLEIEGKAAVLTMQRFYLDAIGQIIIYSENYCVGERSPFVIELVRQ